MIAQTPWVERKFNFDFPEGLNPVFLDRLLGTPLRVEAMVKGLTDAHLSLKINNKWSIKELIGHLIDIEELQEKRLEDYIEGRATLSAADMANKKTEDAHHNDKPIETLITELRISRLHFVQQLERVNEDLIIRKSLHPRLKIPMRLVDMVYFVCEHDDHHLAKMRELANHLPSAAEQS